MKKEKFQILLLSLAFAISFSSYTYLNCVAKPKLEANESALMLLDEEHNSMETDMPDLRFVDHFFKMVKIVLPAQ